MPANDERGARALPGRGPLAGADRQACRPQPVDDQLPPEEARPETGESASGTCGGARSPRASWGTACERRFLGGDRGGLDRGISTVRYWIDKYGLGPTHGGLRRAALERARFAGEREVQFECRRHGTTAHVIENGGRVRCKRCRSEAVAEQRRRTKRTLVEEAGGACVICGYNRCVAALEFHHLDPSKKRFALSRDGVTRSFAEAQEEARKCVLLCSNCHAEVESGMTASRRHGHWAPPERDNPA